MAPPSEGGGERARGGEARGGGGAGGGAPTGGRRLLLFGKLPEPGRTKTRLSPRLGEEAAARLYRGFLDDAAEIVRAVEAAGRELWIGRREGARRTLARRYPFLDVRWQPAGDLGRRMRVALGAAFRSGAERALVFGSDHPTLPASHLAEMLDRLDGADASLGPTADGGYYALALRRSAWPAARQLFEGIDWSTSSVLDQTRSRARAAGLSVHEAPAWYDVDEPADLARLRRDVRPGSATHRVLEALGELTE